MFIADYACRCFQDVDFFSLYPNIPALETTLPAFVAHRVRKLETPRQLITEIDNQPEPKPRLKPIPLKSFMSSRASQVSNTRFQI